MNTKRGQVPIGTIITTAGMIFASIIASWGTASSRAGTTETKISIIEERENNHYGEVTKILERLENKLDTLAERSLTRNGK
jgi:hypothetical protein